MTQITERSQSAELPASQVRGRGEQGDSSSVRGVLAQAVLDIGRDIRTHADDIRAYNSAALARRDSRWGRLGQHVMNGGRAAAYTSYFWADDYLMRPVANQMESTTATVSQ